MEFESHRCDEVHDSKFPRTRTQTIPWKFYRDSVYYRLNCKLPPSTNKRKRRAIEVVHEVNQNKTRSNRGKRSIPKNIRKFKIIIGTIKS